MWHSGADGRRNEGRLDGDEIPAGRKTKQRIVQLFKKHGMASRALAARFNVGTSVINEILRRAGLTPRKTDDENWGV
jgi:hypothetical protein